MKMRRTGNFDGWFVATMVSAALIGVFLIVLGIAAMLITLPVMAANAGLARGESFRYTAAMESHNIAELASGDREMTEHARFEVRILANNTHPPYAHVRISARSEPARKNWGKSCGV